MKILNLTEKEVIKQYKKSNYWQIIGRPLFKKVKCQETFQPNLNEAPVFEKGTEYAIWICDIKDKKQGSVKHYVAVPQLSDPQNKERDGKMIISQEIFGMQNYSCEKTFTDIEGERYRLVLMYNGFFELMPAWQFEKDEVEKYLRKTEDDDRITRYTLYPRVVGKNMNNAFAAYEVVRYCGSKRLYTTYFNCFAGKEVRASSCDGTFISLTGKPKPPVINSVTASYSYEKKRIIMNFR